MSKRLTGNLNTKYMEAANKLHLSAESNRKKVVCYVESYTDIFFWRSILDDFRRDGIEFQIMLPSRTNLSRGKKQAMMNKLGENLGKYMIACVDSDYDYLLQGTSTATSSLNCSSGRCGSIATTCIRKCPSTRFSTSCRWRR